MIIVMSGKEKQSNSKSNKDKEQPNLCTTVSAVLHTWLTNQSCPKETVADVIVYILPPWDTALRREDIVRDTKWVKTF